MTDRPLLEKRLAIIDTSLAELRRLARVDRIDVVIRERRFVEHTLQVAIQAALDVASHIVSDRRLGEPATNRDSFLLLERDGWIASDLRGRLADMAGFRNVLVHAYLDVGVKRVHELLVDRLEDFVEYVASRRSLSRARGVRAGSLRSSESATAAATMSQSLAS